MKESQIKEVYTKEEGEIIAKAIPVNSRIMLGMIFSTDIGRKPKNAAEMFNMVVSDVEFGGDLCKPEYDAILAKAGVIK